jgi:hypothetical protein
LLALSKAFGALTDMKSWGQLAVIGICGCQVMASAQLMQFFTQNAMQ